MLKTLLKPANLISFQKINVRNHYLLKNYFKPDRGKWQMFWNVKLLTSSMQVTCLLRHHDYGLKFSRLREVAVVEWSIQESNLFKEFYKRSYWTLLSKIRWAFPQILKSNVFPRNFFESIKKTRVKHSRWIHLYKSCWNKIRLY